jgi:hypothetical protein
MTRTVVDKVVLHPVVKGRTFSTQRSSRSSDERDVLGDAFLSFEHRWRPVS